MLLHETWVYMFMAGGNVMLLIVLAYSSFPNITSVYQRFAILPLGLTFLLLFLCKFPGCTKDYTFFPTLWIKYCLMGLISMGYLFHFKRIPELASNKFLSPIIFLVSMGICQLILRFNLMQLSSLEAFYLFLFGVNSGILIFVYLYSHQQKGLPSPSNNLLMGQFLFISLFLIDLIHEESQLDFPDHSAILNRIFFLTYLGQSLQFLFFFFALQQQVRQQCIKHTWQSLRNKNHQFHPTDISLILFDSVFDSILNLLQEESKEHAISSLLLWSNILREIQDGNQRQRSNLTGEIDKCKMYVKLLEKKYDRIISFEPINHSRLTISDIHVPSLLLPYVVREISCSFQSSLSGIMLHIEFKEDCLGCQFIPEIDNPSKGSRAHVTPVLESFDDLAIKLKLISSTEEDSKNKIWGIEIKIPLDKHPHNS